jgi:hypothetical protein
MIGCCAASSCLAASPQWVIFSRRAPTQLTAAYPQIASVLGGGCWRQSRANTSREQLQQIIYDNIGEQLP